MDQSTTLLRHRFLIILTMALIAVLLIAMANNLSLNEPAAAAAEAFCAFVLSLGLMAYLFRRAEHLLPMLIVIVDIVIIHLLYVTLRNESLAGAYSLSVMFPVLAAYFFSARRYLVWSGVFAISLIAHVALITPSALHSGLTWQNLIRILIVYALVVYITLGDRWMTEVFTSSVQAEAKTQKQLAAHLQHEVEEFKEAERAKSLFVSLASHQLRSPLTALRWSLEAYSHDAKRLTPPQRRAIDSARDSTLRMIQMVTELLNVSRIDSGRLRIVPTPTDLNQLVTDAVTDIQPLARAEHIQLDIQPLARAIHINLDPVLISQVIINLLSNAVKYSRPRSTVQLKLTQLDTIIRCEVMDQGIGIPASEQPKVFQQMFRADNAQRVDEGGSGLGLFLAKSIVRLSGGEIGFRSKEKVGSTFWFTLPISGSPARDGEIGFEKTVPI